ncbi:flagellar filament capping protein FliD [Anaerosinus massiliensis]|uniref:flagellar filament capping protein FliD n=1 Tax=Massilibacillus massiliensis TaxID=1806837 RepID=UPI000DA5F289|nr:flagellar filament capping protein FliD [Massilibacillus massiliensis]
MNVNSVTAQSNMSYLKYTLAKNNSKFNSVLSTSNSYDYLFNSGSTSSSNQTLWNSSFSSKNAAADPGLILATMQKYTKTSNAFYPAFASTSTNLQTSSAKLTDTLKNTDTSTKDTVDRITAFVDDYNATTKLFNKNSNTSSALSALSVSFSSGTSSLRKSLATIGITVQKDGTMAADKEALTDAVKNEYGSVQSLLGGSTGLANQAYTKIKIASNRASDLVPFPDFTKMTTSSASLGLLADLYA